MALENALYVDQLETAWPATGDQTAQGDDHLRLLKEVLKRTFPGLGGVQHGVIVKGASFTPALNENSSTFVSSAALTATLPVASGLPLGTFYEFAAVTGAITVAAGGTDTILGGSSLMIAPGTAGRLSRKSATEWVFMRYGDFEPGTRLLFPQATAPLGWTQVVETEADNRMLRVVKTAGGGSGGSHSPILNDVVPSHTHSLVVESGGAHTHTITDPGHTHTYSRPFNGGGVWSGGDDYFTTGNTGAATTGITVNNGGAHTHTGTASDPAGAANWTPRYLDLILCARG